MTAGAIGPGSILFGEYSLRWQAQVARFVGEMRVALVLEGINTFGGGWSIAPIGSESWNFAVDKARHVMRLGFGETECARAIEMTGKDAGSLWPEDLTRDGVS